MVSTDEHKNKTKPKVNNKIVVDNNLKGSKLYFKCPL